jgi:hypothetical protein
MGTYGPGLPLAVEIFENTFPFRQMARLVAVCLDMAD